MVIGGIGAAHWIDAGNHPVGVEANHQAAHVTVVGAGVHHCHRLTASRGAQNGVVARAHILRAQAVSGLGKDAVGATRNDDIDIPQLGGQGHLILELLQVG